MAGLNQPLLINILGHAGGALIFAIFLFLLFSGRGWSGTHGRNLTAVAAILSLVWNLGSLVVLAWPGLSSTAMNLVVAVSFSVLSLLPAVLLHLSLKDTQPVLTACGYALSTAAVGMHFWEIRRSDASLHQLALLIITIGFLALTAAAVAASAVRGRERTQSGTRIIASMCLALFATSFVHFGQGHAASVWSTELIIHHAGIPLALLILLQDYRFVLLDAFVRFLANALLAAVLTGLVIEAAFRLVLVERAAREPLPEAALLISVCLFLVLFAWLRGRLQAWLTRAVFRQTTASGITERLASAPEFRDETRYLDWAGSAVAGEFRTKEYGVVTELELGEGAADYVTANLISSPKWSWAEAIAPVRLGEGQSKFLLLGRREGGRRYLSHDLDALTKAGAQIRERLEALRREEMNRLVSQAELRALQAQINPHFLFNALNTLYGTIPRESAGARKIVLNLAEIFRYFLQSERTFVPLSEEMQIVQAYLDLEQLRLGSRLTFEIEVDAAASHVPIPVLSIEPLVENAIKHGVALRTEPGFVRVTAGRRADQLCVRVENSSAGAAANPGEGVGLQNVRRRLEICYGPAYGVELSLGERQSIAEVTIPISRAEQLESFVGQVGR